jgi:hypothetical protein
MNQSINILRKDARQLWPEILSSIAILLLFTVLEPRSWHQQEPFFLFLGPRPIALLALLFAGWGLTIVRLVQAERLVGLNQFWTTRPYEWPKLLTAKGLFLLLFLYLPLMLAQIFLLHHAHLHILENIPLLVWNLFLLTSIFVLPLACFSAVTSSFPQAMMAVIGTVVAVVVAASFDTPRFQDLAPRSLVPVQFILLVTILILALLHQYCSRKTLRSMAIVSLAPLLILVTQATVPGTSLAARDYALPVNPPTVVIQFDQNPLRRSPGFPLDDPNRALFIHLPLTASQIAPGTSFHRDGVRFTLTGANGYTWQSMWRTEDGIIGRGIVSPEFSTFAEVPLPREVYDQLASGPVSVGIEFALEEFQAQPPIRDTISTDGSFVPNLGFCALSVSYERIYCHTAFREPNYFVVDTFRKRGPCTQSGALELQYGLLGTKPPKTNTLHISPVLVTALPLSSNLCPGTPINFAYRKFQRRLQVKMPAATIELKDYLEWTNASSGRSSIFR